MKRLTSSLHIVSWNVASWTTTCTNIAKHHGSVSAWLDHHHVDILCLQEVKATKHKLLSLPAACMLNPNHWDVFLSPCIARPGLNGVATLVRKNRYRGESILGSLPTVGASAKPFGVSDLDNQGRCILTDHGAFTLINVYVPYDGELGVQLGLKLRFLDALIELITKIQKSGRPVICVGDFNVARYSKDVYFEFRLADIDDLVANMSRSIDICEAKIGRPLQDEVLAILNFLKACWPALRDALTNDRKVVEIGGNNGGAPKYALKVGKEKPVQIGQRQTSGSACDGIANPNPILTKDGIVFKPAGVIQIGDLFEVISKLSGTDFSEQARAAFSDVFARPRACPPVVERFDKLMSQCRLVDTYTQANPAGRSIGSERFTCWDQYRNERYENKGSRIDYIFVDSDVVKSVRLVDDSDDPGNMSLLNTLAVSSDRAKALSAVTAENRWRPVPFAGGGIDGDSGFSISGAKNFEFLFTSPPQTGIVYTAPLFSDHVATSCVLDMAALGSEGITARATDALGMMWKTAMADCAVVAHSHPAKTHSLKDMFARASKAKSAPADVIDVSESPSESDAKKLRTSSPNTQ